jgi:SAM-dependent methyltransferase
LKSSIFENEKRTGYGRPRTSTRSRLSDLARWFIDSFVMKIAVELPARSKILDAGAGECVYKKYFQHCNYISVDLGVGDEKWDYTNLDYVASLDNLPVGNNTFDAILCTQVLEHLERPQECLREFSRVLKAGGKLYLTVPMAHPEHQVPYDFFRFTSFGLRSLLSTAGFRDIRLQPLGGMFTRWAYELPRLLSIFPRTRSPQGSPSLKGIFCFPVKLICFLAIRTVQCVLLLMEGLDKKRTDPLGWAAIGVKK